MSVNPIVVVVVKKHLIQAAKVVEGQVRDPIEMEWEEELLRKAMKIIKDRYDTSSIRIVLGDDLSHTLQVAIPSSTSEGEERSAVAAMVKEQVPEVITADNWDFKIVSDDGEKKKVTVFVPVQSTYMSLVDAATKEGIEIQAVEPEGVTKARHTDLFLGMAQKTDIQGKDDEVLNIRPVFAVDEEAMGTLEEQGEHMDDKKKFPKWLIVVLVLLLLGGLAFAAISYSRTANTVTASPTPTPSLTIVSPSPSPSPAAVDLSEYKVRVLNGSGVVGRAGVIAAALVEAGFAEPKVGNAATYDFTTTLIERKSTVPEGAYTALVKALGSEYKVKEGSKLTASNEYDIIVTVSTKTGETAATTAPSSSPRASGSASPSPSRSPSGSASPSASPAGSRSPSPSPSSN